MIQYNFKTKKVSNILDDVKYIVNNHCSLEIPCERKNAEVIEIFDKLMVGIPADELGVISCVTFTSNDVGWFMKNHQKVYFTIHTTHQGVIMYLRKRY